MPHDPSQLSKKPFSPPGTWRLLAPALVIWGTAAVLVGYPGVARWVAVAAASVGATVISGHLLRQRRTMRASAGAPHGSRTRASRSRKRVAGAVLLGCAVLLIITLRIEYAHYARDAPELYRANDFPQATVLPGTLTSFPETRSTQYGDRSWVRADVLTTRGDVPVLLWLPGPAERHWAPGMPVSIRGSPERLEDASNAAYAITVREIAERHEASVSRSLGAVAAGLRWRLHDRAAATPGAELVPGFAVGDTSLVSDDLDEQMRLTSLTHLTAVSGANCALITTAIMVVAGRCGLLRRPRIVAAAAGLAGFVLVVGPDASVQRAAVMATVILVSGFGGKRSVALPALALAILALLIADPWQALQPGFTLSVAATGGILLLVPIIDRAMRRALPAFIRLPIAVSFSAQVACGPLLLFLAPDLPAVGVLANVLAAPAAPLGTGIGVIALVLLPFIPTAGAAAVWVASLATRWVAATAEVTSTLPLARWHWPDGWSGALLLIACQALVMVAWAVTTGRLQLPRSAPVRREPWKPAARKPRVVRTISWILLSAAAGIGLGTIVVTPVTERLGVPRDWSVVMCDVGQGDAFLVRDPRAPGSVILVDTGDDPLLLTACLERFSVTSIALALLSHDDADHVGALHHVLDRVDAALIAPDATLTGAERPIVQQLTAAEVPYTVGEAGTRGVVGATPSTPGGHGVTWEVLAPEPHTRPGDTNAASLVVQLDAGDVSLLLLGDTGEAEQRALMRDEPDLDVDVIKVAHHGSRDQHPELYESAGATLGLISVGESNGYGHPTRDTLQMLRESGTQVLRTDHHGSVAVSAVTNADPKIWVMYPHGKTHRAEG